MHLSIVTTMYRSERYVREFYERTRREAEQITDDFEIVFVDDGSPDRSLEIAAQLANSDSRVRVVELSRNFGHHKALMTGLRHAQGRYVFLIDSDLEEEPELLSGFYAELQRDPETDVVYGVQDRRKGSWFERIAGTAHYWILNGMWDVHLPEDVVVARLMRRNYVDQLIRHDESEMVISGIWQSTGFRQRALKVNKLSHSPTTYDLRAKVRLMTRSVTAFSTKPLDAVALTGALSVILAVLVSAGLAGARLASRAWLTEIDVMLLSCWLLGGIACAGIGVVALYLGTVHREVKRRPFTIVRSVHQQQTAGPAIEPHLFTGPEGSHRP